MSDTAKLPRIERTPEQKAEERRIREMHRANPIREVPADTMSGADAAEMLRFAASVQRDREALGLTVEEAAKRAGVDSSVFSKLESGLSYNPSATTMFRIVRALGKKLSLTIDDASH